MPTIAPRKRNKQPIADLLVIHHLLLYAIVKMCLSLDSRHIPAESQNDGCFPTEHQHQPILLKWTPYSHISTVVFVCWSKTHRRHGTNGTNHGPLCQGRIRNRKSCNKYFWQYWYLSCRCCYPVLGSQTSLSLQECLRLLEATFPFGEESEVNPHNSVVSHALQVLCFSLECKKLKLLHFYFAIFQIVSSTGCCHGRNSFQWGSSFYVSGSSSGSTPACRRDTARPGAAVARHHGHHGAASMSTF